MKIKRISHACIQIDTNGTIIYLDPYEIGKKEKKADIILSSHEHYDHFDEKSVKNVQTKETTLIGPSSCPKIMKHSNVKGLVPGDHIESKGIKIEAIPSYNIGKKFHPKENNWLGYILHIEGKRILFGGDTDLIPEYSELGEIDIAILPVGDTYTMDFSAAIKAAGVLKPKIVIPVHEWDSNLNDFKEKLESTYSDIETIILKDNIEEI